MKEDIPGAGIVCTECGGPINFGISRQLQTGCETTSSMYPCAACRRLHFTDGSAAFRRGDSARMFLADGGLVYKSSEEALVN